MLEFDAVTIVGDFAAPVAPIVVGGIPAFVIFVGPIPGVVDLELAKAIIAELPVEGLAESEAVFVAHIETSIAAEEIAAFFVSAVAHDVVDVLIEEVSAPTRGVAGHRAQAVLSVDCVVPIGKPKDGDFPEAQDRVLDDGVLTVLIFNAAIDAPVTASRGVRTGREHRRVVEDVMVLTILFKVIRLEAIRP